MANQLRREDVRQALPSPQFLPIPEMVSYGGVKIKTLDKHVDMLSVLTAALKDATAGVRRNSFKRWDKYKAKHKLADDWIFFQEARDLLFDLVPKGLHEYNHNHYVNPFFHKTWDRLLLEPDHYERRNKDTVSSAASVQTINCLIADLEREVSMVMHRRDVEASDCVSNELRRITQKYAPRDRWRAVIDQIAQSNGTPWKHTSDLLRELWKPFIQSLMQQSQVPPISVKLVLEFLPEPEYSPRFCRSLLLDLERNGIQPFSDGIAAAAEGRHVEPNREFFQPAFIASCDVDTQSIRIDDLAAPEFWVNLRLPPGVRLIYTDGAPPSPPSPPPSSPVPLKRRKLVPKSEDMDE